MKMQSLWKDFVVFESFMIPDRLDALEGLQFRLILGGKNATV